MVVELGRMQRKNRKLMLKSNGMSSKKISVSLDTDEGVKALSEKTGSDENFLN